MSKPRTVGGIAIAGTGCLVGIAVIVLSALDVVIAVIHGANVAESSTLEHGVIEGLKTWAWIQVWIVVGAIVAAILIGLGKLAFGRLSR